MKIKHISAVDQVCDSIKERIKSDLWKTNEKLPSESDLARLFGVNRLTVRMALQKLNTLGIVETKIGNGTYVKSFSFSNYLNEISDFYLNPERLKDVFDLRKLIEIECARLAISFATPEELEKLSELLADYLLLKDKLVKAATTDPKIFNQLVESDLNFHHQIFKMSHNHLYENVFLMVKGSIRQYLATMIQRRDNLRRNQNQQNIEEPDFHVKVYQAICDKDFPACQAAYLAMIDFRADF